MQAIKKWFKRYLSDPEALIILSGVIFAFLVFKLVGNIMVPIIASLVIAYLLDGCINRLITWHVPRLLAVITVFLIFISVMLLILLWLLPLLIQQMTSLVTTEVPHMLKKGQAFLVSLQSAHPEFFSVELFRQMATQFSQYLTRAGHFIVTFSLASIGNIITIVVYLILVPLLVFFFLKDESQIKNWLVSFLPGKHEQISQIWRVIDRKIGDYIRGKMMELIIVGIVTLITFWLLDLDYAMLLAAGVGLSVIIPYIGAILITIPVVAIAFLEWGLSPHFLYLLIGYAIIITLDANLLVPLLFSEKMKLHPVAIVIAVLVFGSLWGFWGIFFAIPLATVVDALIKGWPRVKA